jgi:hypothetical protein
MMYWTFPGVTAGDRLDHSAKLDPAKIVLSPAEAAEKVGLQANPTQIRLNTFDGRPVYRIGGGGRGGGGGPRIVYADTGEEQTEVSTEMLDRIASSWAGRPLSEANKISVEEVDQWTVAGQLQNLRPMYKYTWPDGQQVYLNGITGEVVQYTTFWSRIAAHVSAIPHWVYYTPLRKNQPVWINFMIYGSLIGTIGAILGMIAAVWMYSPRQKYRLAGQPTGVPYRGQKRWHWMFGMVFGLATVTWTFSGLMSLGPFPLMQRLTGQTPRNERLPQPQPQQQTQAPPAQTAGAGTVAQESSSAAQGESRGQRRGDGGRGVRGSGAARRNGEANQVAETGSDPANGSAPREEAGAQQSRGSRSGVAVASARSEAPAPPQPSGGGRGGGQQGIAAALRGRVRMEDFASIHPRDLLATVRDLDVRELQFTSYVSRPLFSANLPGGKSQLLALDGSKIDGFEQQEIIDLVKRTLSEGNIAKIEVIDQYDLYYLDRTRQRPLPVLRVLMNDEERTRYYIDPKSAQVVTTYSDRNWVNRWLYTGLHSLNFPFLYNNRPLWDIVVIGFMLGGTALCVTSLVLSWRVLGRKLRRIGGPAPDVLTAGK